MRCPLFAPVLILSLSCCTSRSDKAVSIEVPLYSDIFTLDLAIEDNDANSEPVLVAPEGIAVDGTGTIYVADEKCLKVFDREGQFIQQIGREGQGPGEFVAAFGVTVGPAGHLTAMDVLWEFNIYAPDYSFLSKSRYRNEELTQNYIQENGFTFTMLRDVISLDAADRIVDLFALDMINEETFPSFEQLLFVRADTLIELCQYHAENSVRTGPGSNTSVNLRGELLWSMTDTGRIVYTESGIDFAREQNGSSYYLNVVFLHDLARDTIAVPFEPLKIPTACKNRGEFSIEVLGRQIDIELDPVVQQMQEQTEYYPSLKALRADGSLLFGFKYSELDSIWHDIEEDGRMIPCTADLIDLRQEKLVARVEFPFIPDVIRNGFAYLLNTPADDYPSIKRYRIDFRIYRRP